MPVKKTHRLISIEHNDKFAYAFCSCGWINKPCKTGSGAHSAFRAHFRKSNAS